MYGCNRLFLTEPLTNKDNLGYVLHSQNSIFITIKKNEFSSYQNLLTVKSNVSKKRVIIQTAASFAEIYMSNTQSKHNDIM